uniref:Peptidase M13 C-terminal domain-containing protein n=1 Tax=Strongyloides venezuelensis TaxID=75913 RepID=A0A0K0EU55_STRVS
MKQDFGHFENLVDTEYMEECYSYFNFSIDNGVDAFSSHSPKDVRLKVTISYYKPFAKVFNCKIGTKVNLKNKCEV